MNERELKTVDKLAFKNREAGFMWGTTALVVPFVGFILLNVYVIEGDYVTWMEGHRFWAGLMVGVVGLWMKGTKYVGVERHDPKRKKAQNE